MSRCSFAFAAALLIFSFAAPRHDGAVIKSERLIIVKTFGQPGVSGWADGAAAQARFHGPEGLDIDASGQIYVADSHNRAIRQITPDGTVGTIAGKLPNPPAAQPPPVGLIFDSDIGDELDDVGALAVLHRFADLGLANILATVGPNLRDYAAPSFEVINRSFGRPEIPIGAAKFGAYPFAQWVGPFIVTNWPSQVRSSATAEDAVKVYRQILNSRPDRSVTVLIVGQLRNLFALWQSAPDSHSPLPGSELVRQKVKEIVVGAGFYPASTNIYPEYNIFTDIHAAKILNVIRGVPIVYPGIELSTPGGGAGTVFFGLTISNRPPGDVVREIFEYAYETQSAGILGAGRGQYQRPAWDGMAALYAVAGLSCNGTNIFSYSAPGTNFIRDDLHNVFTETAGAEQRYLFKSQPDHFYSTLLNNLLNDSGRDQGPSDGAMAEARLGFVTDVSEGAAGTIYFAENFGFEGAVRVIRNGTVSAVRAGDGRPLEARGLKRVAVASDGAVIFSSAGIGLHALWRLEPEAEDFERVGSGSGFLDGTFAEARLEGPAGLSAAAAGAMIFADQAAHAIRKAQDRTITTLAGHPSRQGFADGPVATAQFSNPADAAVDYAGNIYVLQRGEGEMALRKIGADGLVTTVQLPAPLAASWAASPVNDSCIEFDPGGRLVISDSVNHAILICQIDTAPTLQITASAGFATFHWVAAPGEFVVESAFNLTGPVEWREVQGELSQAQNLHTLKTAAAANAEYFRLRRRN